MDKGDTKATLGDTHVLVLVEQTPEATLQSVTLMQFGAFVGHQSEKKDKLAGSLVPGNIYQEALL